MCGRNAAGGGWIAALAHRRPSACGESSAAAPVQGEDVRLRPLLVGPPPARGDEAAPRCEAGVSIVEHPRPGMEGHDPSRLAPVSVAEDGSPPMVEAPPGDSIEFAEQEALPRGRNESDVRWCARDTELGLPVLRRPGF